MTLTKADDGPGAGLTARQQLFVAEYVRDGVARRAAEAAGYKHASVAAAKLLADPVVKLAVQRGLEEKRQGAIVDGRRLIEELARVGLIDVGGAFDDEGMPLPLSEMPEDVRRALKSIVLQSRRVRRYKGDGDREGEEVEVDVRVIRVEFHDKLSAIAQLAKQLDLSNENRQTVVIDWSGMTAPPAARPDPVRDRLDAERRMPRPALPGPVPPGDDVIDVRSEGRDRR